MPRHKKNEQKHSKKAVPLAVIIPVAVIIIVIAVVVWQKFLAAPSVVTPGGNGNSASAGAGEIAATVNGEPIYAHDIEKFISTLPVEQRTAENKYVKLNDSIIETLLLQEAKSNGFVPSTATADEYISGQLKANNVSKEQYAQTLADRGVTYDDAVTYFAKNMAINGYLNKSVFSSITITEAELRDFFDQNLASSNMNYTEIHAQLNATIFQQKAQEGVAHLVDGLRSKSDIVINAKFSNDPETDQYLKQHPQPSAVISPSP